MIIWGFWDEHREFSHCSSSHPSPKKVYIARGSLLFGTVVFIVLVDVLSFLHFSSRKMPIVLLRLNRVLCGLATYSLFMFHSLSRWCWWVDVSSGCWLESEMWDECAMPDNQAEPRTVSKYKIVVIWDFKTSFSILISCPAYTTTANRQKLHKNSDEESCLCCVVVVVVRQTMSCMGRRNSAIFRLW